MSKADAPVRAIPTEAYFALVRQKLFEEGRAYVRVTGMSMWPLLHHLRDGVILAPPDRIRAGDIVLFDRRTGRYALHRVIRIKGNVFTMAGDNQAHAEKNLPCDQIVGVAVAIDRKGRQIASRNFGMRIYALALTWTAFPRIYLRRAIQKLKKLCRSSATPGKKGVC